MRLNDCLVSKEFADAMKSDNSTLFVKVLRERIFEELKLTEESNAVEELDWTKSVDFFNAQGGAEVEYRKEYANNLAHIDGVGLNNLIGRANGESAHENAFDQLLADYFMQSRKQHKKGN